MSAFAHRPASPSPRLSAAIALSTVVALVLGGCAQSAGTADPGAPEARVADRTALKEAMSDAVRHGIPGILVRVDNGGATYELVDQAEWTEPLSASSTFRVGSNTKTATAVLVLQLVEAGKLGLDDPLSNWFDDLPHASTTTVRMLLNHTAGLAEYAYGADVLAAVAGQRADLPDEQELVDEGVRATLAGEPLEGFNYSNTGYILLGQIVERVSGESIEDLFLVNVATPLGLTATHFADPGEVASMHGYEPDAEGIAPLLPPGTPKGFGFAGMPATDGWVDVTQIDQGWNKAAGSIISTGAEWATFQRALAAGELVSDDLLDEMRVTVPEGEEEPDRSYGLGLEKVETPCGTVWGHDGALPGYRADTYTDERGTRSVTVVATTHFGMLAQPEASSAHEQLVEAAICAMYEDDPAA